MTTDTPPRPSHGRGAAAPGPVPLLPREHGAYGQLLFPLVTGLLVAGPSVSGLWTIAAACALFVAHEPAAVLLGVRGVRARREQRGRAMRWLAITIAMGLIAGLAAVATARRDALWAFLPPLAAGAVLLAAMISRREKTSFGEVAAAVAFASLAVPICAAAGAPPETAAVVAIPFALLTVAGTLAVRVVIVRVRGGGNPRAAAATRRAAFTVGAAGIAALAAAGAYGWLPWTALLASLPGLGVATVVAARPPSPAKLRTLGWTLVAASAATMAIVLAGSW